MRTGSILLAAAMLAVLSACGAGTGPGEGPSAVSDGDPDPATAGASGAIVVTVVDADGDPVEGAQVLPESLEDPDLLSGQMSRPTGADGRYEMEAAPGRYRVAVSFGASPASDPQEVDVAADATVEIMFELDA
ncbi:hypothetical protein GCM10009830_18650 [Glycomyces endophyticus]|uniref:Carboxypeptidase regulatory-like domain-containing protein n=1 Tax=Glycomyces endophyticus TaxID=480996 RepID=A0ABN2GKC8_9ACTN